MTEILPINCPKCNNSHSFYRYGKDKLGFQKYQCRKCYHQFSPNRPKPAQSRAGKHPPCPMCGKASFLHHDYDYYSNYRCSDKKCYHSFFVAKPAAIDASSVSQLIGKSDFKRMRHPVHVILSALTMFFVGKSSFRDISFMLKTLFNIRISHVTVGHWCKKFAPMFHNMQISLMPSLNFNSDEWHADETVIKINGVKHYIWFIVDSETRFVLGFHLSPHRDSAQAFSLIESVKPLGKPLAIVSDRYSAYRVPVNSFGGVDHIRVASFKDDVSNNLIEAFNHQFKAWYKTKQGFCSFESANNLIFMFVFFYNFVRPHSALNNLTPAQVAGLNLTKKQKQRYLLVA